MAIKQPPFNKEVEQAVLGAIIVSSTMFGESLGEIDVEDFFDKKNKIVFNIVMELFEKRIPIDVTTITTELINNKQLEEVGGTDYLLELSDKAVTYTRFEDYVTILKNTSSLRSLLFAMDGIINDYNSKKIEDINNFVMNSETKITDITRKRRVSEFRPASEVTQKVKKELDVLKKNATEGSSSLIGVTTGFPELNKYIHGFQKGTYVVIAARTGVGKTAFVLNLAYNVATKGNAAVALFSLEMKSTEVMKRLLSAESNVPHDSLITGFINARDRLSIDEACQKIDKTKFYFHEEQGIKVLDILAKCRQLKARDPDLSLVIVDHVGLVQSSKNTKSRQEEIQDISINLKRLAMELNVTVIGVAQVNREVDKNPNKTPELSNLRESGSLEQDADIVLFLSRDDYYDSASKTNKKDKFNQSVMDTVKSQNLERGTSLMNVKIAKNRSGRTGSIQLLFRRDYMKFDTPSKEFIDSYLENQRKLGISEE